jgi:hypothetical protein
LRLIVFQIVDDLLNLATVALNRRFEVLLGAGNACTRVLTNFEQVQFRGQHLFTLSLKPSNHSEQTVHLFSCEEIFMLFGVPDALCEL